MTQIVRVPTLTDINFEQLKHAGVSHLFTDIESTLSHYGSPEVDPYTVEFLETQRCIGNIATISLITNKRSQQFAMDIANQIGADAYHFPETKEQRKPSPDMLHIAARVLDIPIGEAVMVGDKLTGDIQAARRAGVPYAFWVNRLGKTDHPGDRYIRRPYERLFRCRYPSQLIVTS